MINKTSISKRHLGKSLTLKEVYHMMKRTLLKGDKIKLAYCGVFR